MEPLISIIIPTYNRAYILGNAIKSVLEQTYSAWELIIVDNGSTDNTQEYINKFKDNRIITVKEPNNLGPALARNKGLEVANGEWITYLDCDNEFLPNYLTSMSNHLLRKENVIFALPRSYRTKELYKEGVLIKSINSSSNLTKDITVKDIFSRSFPFDENGFIHSKQIVLDGLKWDVNTVPLEGWEFAMQIVEKYPNGFLFVPEILVNYHQRFGGMA